MNVLIIGFGSIGKRHFNILSNMKEINSCHVVTSQILEKITTFKSINEVNLNDYDYIVIASKTNLHYEQLLCIEKNVSNKLILVEKPIFHEKKELSIKNNTIFVAYNRRYYPILQKIKELISKDEKCYFMNIITGQYLPNWRPERNYKETYSAKKKEGGGVLLDLSHEIDYIQFLNEEISILSSINTKISDLEIDTDDICTVLAKTKSNVIINFTIDYISKEFIQSIIIHLKSISIYANLKNMELKIVNKDGIYEYYNYSKYEKDYSFEQMHKDIILNKEKSICCTYNEALVVMDKIEDIKKRNCYAA